jgi:hypothetical protein
MDRSQGKLLDPEGRTRFETIDVNVESHTISEGAETWSGYFELPTASGVIAGETFRLVLEDGRAQDILIEFVEAVDPHTPRVLFTTAGLPQR